MADITPKLQAVYQDGGCSTTVLFAVKGCTAGDTLDVASWFGVVKRTGLISITGTTVNTVPFTGTVLTLPAGPAGDAAWLLVYGVAFSQG